MSTNDNKEIAEFTKTDLVPEEDVKKVISEAQRKIISGDIAVEDIDLVPVGGGNWVPYVKWQKVIDILNKSTRWNWDYQVDEYIGPRENENGKFEVMVKGRLNIYGSNGSIRTYYAIGGSLIRDNPNLTTADYFEGAISRMIRKASQRFGIGLHLSDDWVCEKALTHYGKQDIATPKIVHNFMDLIGATSEEKIADCLKKLDIDYEGWEIKSKKAVRILTSKVNNSDYIIEKPQLVL